MTMINCPLVPLSEDQLLPLQREIRTKISVRMRKQNVNGPNLERRSKLLLILYCILVVGCNVANI
jgi:hypothetical protein